MVDPMAFPDSEDRGDLYGIGEPYGSVVQRYSRRQVLKAGMVLAAGAVVPGCASSDGKTSALPEGYAVDAPVASDNGRLTFTPIPPGTTDVLSVPPGYAASVLIGWGDPLFDGDTVKDPLTLTPEEQERRFGYNCDFVAFTALGREGGEGLLWVNHEHTSPAIMFVGYDSRNPTRQQVLVELAAHGGSLLHVRRRSDGTWAHEKGPKSRRITATTPITLSGPAAGHRLLKTREDPSGTRVLGTLNNCGGGTTPWGTILTAEENFNLYFANQARVEDRVLMASHRRYGLPANESERRWEQHEARFDLAQEPNEPHRFGWIVEIDPTNPRSTPVKRTALGRFKHEAATVVLANDGRAVVYSGDDERFEYAYKFVSDGYHDVRNPQKSANLLDAGTLHVARFDDNGSGEWTPLRHSDPRLSGSFDSQGELLIRVREAADKVGATKMDRPEDIETSPTTGHVYMLMTNNTSRVETAPDDRPGTGVNSANPRPNNLYGHILEVREDGGDPAATAFTWSIFMLCGPKGDASRAFGGFPPDQVSDIAAPDNVAFDAAGNLWIATDGQRAIKQNDSLQAVAAAGPDRGKVLNFLTAPLGAEVTGPCLTPDNTGLFVSIQHPGVGGSLARLQSTWPDGKGYPRPSVVAVTKTGGGRIGS